LEPGIWNFILNRAFDPPRTGEAESFPPAEILRTSRETRFAQQFANLAEQNASLGSSLKAA
jgi:hypothetical protein